MYMNKDIRKNGSGYIDNTAYEAIKNCDQGGRKMECNRGEIWEVEISGATKTVLIIQDFKEGGYVSGIALYDYERENENPIEIRATSMMYGDAGRIQYVYISAMSNYVRSLTESELDLVLTKVSEALGLCRTENKEEAGEKPKPTTHSTPEGEKKAEMKIAMLENERDIFKGLYNDLLARAIGNGRGE